jgi:DNA-binding response OmpR family regulator
MNTPSSAARVLVASDDPALADEIRRALKPHFDQVDVSTNPKLAGSEFDTFKPDVLLLGFQGLGKSFRYYRGLHQTDRTLHRHRVILLCSKEELPAAFGLCKNLCFDDYVLYWPFTHDGLRLPMSVRMAYRDMMDMGGESERAAALRLHVRYVEDHESRVDHESSPDMGKVTAAHRALLQLEHELVGAGNELSHRETPSAVTSTPEARATPALSRDFERTKTPPFVQPGAPISVHSEHDIDPMNRPRSGTWALTGSIRGARPLLLVVEGDKLTQDLIAQSLDSQIYDALFVCDAVDALHNLKFVRPQLILVDVRLPGMNGVSLTQYLKATVHLANIPVIMMIGDTGSETSKISRKAGASDFVAKPFTRESLLAKLESALTR